MEKGIENYLRFLKGDQSEMRTIVELYWDSMLLFTNSYLHDLQEAEDIAQEALIRLCVKRPHFQEDHQLKAYLMRICRNLALNHLKKQGRLTAVTPEMAEVIPDDTIAVEDRMEMGDTQRQLHHAMQKLRQDYREVLYLRYFADLSMKEAAKVMHISEKQATAIAYQARQQLKKLLEKEGYTGEELR